MSTTKWTDEQLSAINTRNCNLLVAAAAGSGKTAVLVERIIKIITNEEQPVDIDKLLVVTFTNAAAAEMRERIAAAISKELDKTPNSKNLQKQLTLLNRSNITTMHSFCLDVIKNNFHKIDLDPSFRIGDQTECILIKNEAIEELFEDLYDKDDHEFIDLVEAFSNYKNDENLKDLILDLYNFTMSGPWPEKWLNESCEEFNVKTLEELSNRKWVNILSESIKVELEGYIKMMDRAVHIIKYTEGLDPYLSNFEEELNQIKSAYSSIDNGLESMYKSLTGISFGRLKSIKKDAVFDKDAQDTVKKIRDDIKKKISDLVSTTFAVTPEDILVNIQGAYPYMKKLSEVVLKFSDIFNKKKKDKNILDFNDLEHFCLRILSEHDESGNMIPSSVAGNFRDFFDEVLVDEYQDSNNIQETIINLVSRKESDIPNVFMVGDVKQSIYRFRQAKPELFIEKYNTYDTKQGINRKIQLYKNFRSRREILDSVNFIFKELMSETVGELEYTSDEALNLGASYKVIDDENSITGGAIEVNIIDKTKETIADTDEDVQDEEELDSANLEARLVANRINQLMSLKGDKVFKVLDKESGEYRPLRYKDIVILLRATKNWSETLVDELGEHGIPVYADTGSGYFETIEIRTIMSLLKIVDNPMQDVPMISVLRSPIMGFTADELTDIRIVNKEKYFYENIKFIKDSDSYPNEFREKCSHVLESIDKWREKAIYTPIDEFIWYLYMDTAYYGYVGAMPNGMLRQANLKILFQRAKQFEQTSFKGLFNFINFINKLTKSSGDMGSAKILGENEDVVRIMSIHKSKGLEFPVVFLCGTGKQFNLMDLNKSVLYHDELGLGPDYIDLDRRFSISTLAKDAIKKKMRLETLSEEMRILYVAGTRAKEKLIITGTTRNMINSIDKWVSAASLDKNLILPSEVLKGKSYLDWIGMALCQHNDGSILRQYVGASDGIAKDDSSKWDIRLWNRSDFINKEKVEEEESNIEELTILDNNLNKEVIDEITKKLEYVYPLIEVTKIKSNISVSELKKKNQEENLDIEDMFKSEEKNVITPKFLQEEKGITAAERGTALHFVMRKLDLTKVSSLTDIKIQIQELFDGEFLSEEEFKSINVYKVLKFFRSDIGKQVIQAFNENKLYREVSFYTEISSREVYNELDNKYSDEKIRLQGIIDCFFEINNEIVLLDYKTDYVEEGKEEELKDKYIKQLEYYSEAIFKMIGKKVSKKYLYSFYLEKEIKLD